MNDAHRASPGSPPGPSTPGNAHLPTPKPRYGPRPVEPDPEPTFRFEIVLLGGPEGKALQAEQTSAIMEVLRWLHTHQRREKTTGPG